MLIALLLQAAIAVQPQAPMDPSGQALPAPGNRGEVRMEVTVDETGRVVGTRITPRALCPGGTIQAGMAPGAVYRGEPVSIHPPIHVPGAFPDEGVYAAVIRIGPDGCNIPVPISLPYARPRLEGGPLRRF